MPLHSSLGDRAKLHLKRKTNGGTGDSLYAEDPAGAETQGCHEGPGYRLSDVESLWGLDLRSKVIAQRSLVIAKV